MSYNNRINPVKNDIPSLFQMFAGSFDIGAAVNPTTIRTQESLLVKHFGSFTAENQMKFGEIHPEENCYRFEPADEIVEFALQHGKKMRGHTLVWHNQTGDWLFADEQGGPVSKEQLFERLNQHIDVVVSRYRGKVYCWDVVNEAIEDSGTQLLRNSKWLEIAGEDFIPKAFEMAHRADPQALLFYNDYNETNPEKRDKIYTLVKSLLDKEVPIHGIGMQGHWNIYGPSLDEIRQAIEKYASLGVQLQITELDLSVFKHQDKRTDLSAPTEEMMELQQQRYEDIFNLFREYKNAITAVTFWGAADDYTWLDDFPVRGRKNWPLLFDIHQEPKAAFWKIIK